jgi:hypothetical protein
MGEQRRYAGLPADTQGAIFARVWELFEEGELLVSCAWCERIRLDERWVEPPSSALAAIDASNLLSHAICDDCSQREIGLVARS